MLSQFLIGLIDLLVFPSAMMNNCSFAVIRYENSGDTAKIFVYMDMCIDLWVLLHVQECFHVCILAVCHRIDKYVGLKTMHKV